MNIYKNNNICHCVFYPDTIVPRKTCCRITTF